MWTSFNGVGNKWRVESWVGDSSSFHESPYGFESVKLTINERESGPLIMGFLFERSHSEQRGNGEKPKQRKLNKRSVVSNGNSVPGPPALNCLYERSVCVCVCVQDVAPRWVTSPWSETLQSFSVVFCLQSELSRCVCSQLVVNQSQQRLCWLQVLFLKCFF